MHGRVKVKSSEEQEAAKKKEKAEKVRLYREVTNRIYEKRAAGDLDDEALKLTYSVLIQNPEISTLWNYRREIIIDRLETMSEDESVKLCNDELSLLESCLGVNPKAYCIWLHRQWIMTHSPAPNWPKEMSLCNLFLRYDARNFHCWDYRRFVISKSPEVTTEDEFKFTYQKIAANFSNYSAWHYRSKLLPKLHPSPDSPGGVAEEALLKEYELAQNAFFTDPSDQSAWFYQRWLLGKVEKPVAISCVLVRRDPVPAVYVTFNQPVKVSVSDPIEVIIGEAPPLGFSGGADWPESLHECLLPSEALSAQEGVVVKVRVHQMEAAVSLGEGERESWWLSSAEEMFSPSLTAATSTVLQSELSSCKDLLDMEPDNKWCILTTTLLMQALDAQTYFTDISDSLYKLCEVDSYRAGYYKDLLSKFVMEHSLKESLKQLSPSDRCLKMADKSLSQLFFAEHLLLYRSVDLSGNQLCCLRASVRCLVSVCELNLDGNQLEQLPKEMAALRLLRVLSLKDNKISEVNSLDCLRGLDRLECLSLSGNPVSQQLVGEDVQVAVQSLLPQLKQIS